MCGISYALALDDFYVFTVKPRDNWYQVRWSREPRSSTNGCSNALNPGLEENLLRFAVRGDTMTVFVNGQEVERAQHESLTRRGGVLRLFWSM